MAGLATVHAARVARGVLIVAREQLLTLRAVVVPQRGSIPNGTVVAHPPVTPRTRAPTSDGTPAAAVGVSVQEGRSSPESQSVPEAIPSSDEAPVTSDLPTPSSVSQSSESETESLTAPEDVSPPDVEKPEPTVNASQHVVRERAVPESALARVVGFGALAAGLATGAAAEVGRRAFGLGGASDSSYSAFVTDANAERLATSLSRMRGAALKLGQMLSIQDERVVPAPILKALERVRQGADIMPRAQLQRVLAEAYGTTEWQEKIGVVDFEEYPIAAASIGQVHRGKLRDGDKIVDVVFKIQYPGVARSISSDLNNLKRLVSVGNMIPDNFYVDEAIAAAREELERECDYDNEAESQARYRELVLNSELANDFYVPKVYPSASTKTVLVSEFVTGVPVDKVTGMAEKNRIATLLLRLTLVELFEFGFMQTDPNFANFFYDSASSKMNLIDFGAAREYDPKFLREYLRLIEACAQRDAARVLKHSENLGFLTGEEPQIMREAHVRASFLVGEPFHASNRGGYDFANNDIPARTAEAGKIMLKYRLTPPPREAYSLHRRLSGAFLTSTRMGAKIDAAKMLEETLRRVAERSEDEESDEDYYSANASPAG